jgi:hypothetical protein
MCAYFINKMNTPEQHAAFKQGLDNFLNQNKDQIYSGIGDFISDQMMTKEEKEAKSKKKREEIEARERKERESAAPSLADLFSGFKFGSGRSPFYHMQGAGFGPNGEYIPPTD